jgi:hypothetical protein
MNYTGLLGDLLVSELVQNSYFSSSSISFFWRQGQPILVYRNITLCRKYLFRGLCLEMLEASVMFVEKVGATKV